MRGELGGRATLIGPPGGQRAAGGCAGVACCEGAAGLVAGGAGAALVGCGGGAAPDTPPATLSTQPVQVVLSTDWNSTTRMAVMETMKREFMRAHPNVTVEVDYFTSASSSGGSAGTYSEKVIAALVADTPPDVIANFAYAPHVDRMADLTRDAPGGRVEEGGGHLRPPQPGSGGQAVHALHEQLGQRLGLQQEPLPGGGHRRPTEAWTLDEVLDTP